MLEEQRRAGQPNKDFSNKKNQREKEQALAIKG
jgi:hypothetical protein